MRWGDRKLPDHLLAARLAWRSLAPGVLWPALMILLTTVSIARADVHGFVPVITSAWGAASADSESAACRTLECVRRHVDALTTVRLQGEFGRFTGRVTRWDADSLAAFEVDPDWGGAAPVAPIGWSQISRVDQRVSNSGRGAVIGAITLGAIGALFAATVTAASVSVSWGGSDANQAVGQAALGGALIGGALGAGIGAGFGSSSHHWKLIYLRR